MREIDESSKRERRNWHNLKARKITYVNKYSVSIARYLLEIFLKIVHTFPDKLLSVGKVAITRSLILYIENISMFSAEKDLGTIILMQYNSCSNASSAKLIDSRKIFHEIPGAFSLIAIFRIPLEFFTRRGISAENHCRDIYCCLNTKMWVPSREKVLKEALDEVVEKVLKKVWADPIRILHQVLDLPVSIFIH